MTFTRANRGTSQGQGDIRRHRKRDDMGFISLYLFSFHVSKALFNDTFTCLSSWMDSQEAHEVLNEY